jgi:hypothetical protein
MAPLSPCNRDRLACIQSAGTRSGGVGIQQRHQNADNSRFKRFLRHRSCRPGRRQDLSRVRFGQAPLFRSFVNPSLQKYSTLPKFGNIVCVAHPGSPKRGDLVSSRFASRACGGRSSVGRERSRAGRIALREPKTSCRRAALSGSSRQHSSGNVDNVGG